jgi:hypothetical protein
MVSTLIVFCAAALVYSILLVIIHKRNERRGSMATLASSALVFGEAWCGILPLTITERLLIIFPLCLNAGMSWAAQNNGQRYSQCIHNRATADIEKATSGPFFD